jgi:hypothetical protein
LAEQYLQLILVILIDKLEELHYHLFGALNWKENIKIIAQLADVW